MAAEASGVGSRFLATLLVLGLVVLIAAPPLLPKYFLDVLISVLFTAYLGASWNILGGYAGQFSFGHAAFFGIGAYTSTLLLLTSTPTPTPSPRRSSGCSRDISRSAMASRAPTSRSSRSPSPRCCAWWP